MLRVRFAHTDLTLASRQFKRTINVVLDVYWTTRVAEAAKPTLRSTAISLHFEGLATPLQQVAFAVRHCKQARVFLALRHRSRVISQDAEARKMAAFWLTFGEATGEATGRVASGLVVT